MLVLMRGYNVIKGKIASDEERHAKPELAQKILLAHTFLFIRTNQKHRPSVLLLEVLDQRGVHRIGRAVAKSRHGNGQKRARAFLRFDELSQLHVFAVGSHAIG